MANTGELFDDLAAQMRAHAQRLWQFLAEYLNGGPTDLEPGFLTVQQAAKRYRIGASMLQGLVRRGTLPHRRVGKYICIRAADADRHLRAQPPAFASSLEDDG